MVMIAISGETKLRENIKLKGDVLEMNANPPTTTGKGPDAPQSGAGGRTR
jgi:hypothetical protein